MACLLNPEEDGHGLAWRRWNWSHEGEKKRGEKNGTYGVTIEELEGDLEVAIHVSFYKFSDVWFLLDVRPKYRVF